MAWDSPSGQSIFLAIQCKYKLASSPDDVLMEIDSSSLEKKLKDTSFLPTRNSKWPVTERVQYSKKTLYSLNAMALIKTTQWH
jgi:hypothetical protein